jgi:hypothetical protein
MKFKMVLEASRRDHPLSHHAVRCPHQTIFSLDKMVIFVDNRGYEKMVCCVHEIEK